MFRRLAMIRSPLLAAMCMLWLAMACSTDAPRNPHTPQAIGVTDTEILIGSSLPLSGHAQYLGTQTLSGALTYLNHINDTGGIHGRRLRLTAYDDAYDPTRCLANTQRLLIDDHVFALFCYVGTPTTVKIIPLVDQARIPLLGMLTGANALREPFNRNIINVRASYYQETEAAVRHLVEDLGLTRIAVLYQYDAFGFDGLTGTELALRHFNLAPVARGSYVRGTTNIEEALRRIAPARPQAVVMIGTYEPCAAFVTGLATQGLNPVFYTVSFVGGEELARRLDKQTDAVVLMSQVVPPPADAAGPASELASEYVRLLAAYYPGETPSFIGLEGFINAKVLAEGLRRAGRDLTRETFINAVETMSNYPLAPELTLAFSPHDHQGLEKVYLTRLRGRNFEPITDWKALRKELTEHASGSSAERSQGGTTP